MVDSQKSGNDKKYDKKHTSDKFFQHQFSNICKIYGLRSRVKFSLLSRNTDVKNVRFQLSNKRFFPLVHSTLFVRKLKYLFDL